MKKGHKRLIIFELILLILLLLNSFVSNILSGYYCVLFLIILLIIFKYLFGFEKDRNRFIKSVSLEIIICLLAFFVLYYLAGLFISFAKSSDYLNINAIKIVAIPLILTICLKEILRYMMIKKAEGCNIALVLQCVVFIMFDLTQTFNNFSLSSPYTTFMFIALYFLPAISKNVFASYVSLKCGYKPVILYLLVMGLYTYIIPIIPNPNEYIYSIIELLLPMICLYRIYIFFEREKDETIPRDFKKVRISRILISGIIVMFLVYFTSGYFHYHAIVIASGSMEPNIMKGDVVVIEKVKEKKEIEIGEIIAYHHDRIIVVHRLVKKIIVGEEVFFYTKGDANNSMDNYSIAEDDVIGVVNIKIPYIGYPTIWVNEL